MTTAREVWAGLQLLDRQILDRDGLLIGKVDDLEIDCIGESDELYVTAILTGPGVLLRRMGAQRLGRWLQRVNAFVMGRDDDPARIPFNQVIELARDVKVATPHEAVATSSAEQWVRDHIIGHIPGGRHAHE